MDSETEMRKYQGLSASGVNGYSGVMDRSEPASPINGEPYERSNESGSSGTKVEDGRDGRGARPQTMSSDGSFEARDRSAGAYVSKITDRYL